MVRELKREFRCQKLLELYKRYFDKKPERVETGRNRTTFIFRTYVVKLPRNHGGLGDNDWEGSISNAEDSDPNDVQYARTRLVYVGEIPIIFMERVTHAYGERLPEWAMSVDCGQVGYTRSGRLVAYDYGLN
jgi:hypothetical protein